MSLQIDLMIADFSRDVGRGAIVIYNKASLQFELGCFLRSRLTNCKVEVERNVTRIKHLKGYFEKREIDIAIRSSSGQLLSVIELMYPRNDLYPESMFGFCKEIAFLEQLVRDKEGFQSGYFLAFTDGKLFYSGKKTDGIFGLFRDSRPITGTIDKPKKVRGSEVTIAGEYVASWKPVVGDTRYCLIPIVKPPLRKESDEPDYRGGAGSSG